MTEKRAEGPFSLVDLLSVLGGEAEVCEDGSVVMVRNSSQDGRTFEVHVEGALTYLHTYLPKNHWSSPKALGEALRYFDLWVDEFTGTTNPDGDPIIIDEAGLDLTHDVPGDLDEVRTLVQGGAELYAYPRVPAPE